MMKRITKYANMAMSRMWFADITSISEQKSMQQEL
jgi:hypothetical protein